MEWTTRDELRAAQVSLRSDSSERESMLLLSVLAESQLNLSQRCCCACVHLFISRHAGGRY